MLRNILITSAAVAALAAPAFAMGDKKDIVDTAVEAGSFQTLVTAVKAAGLVETLKGDGPFTVFAPTDETFAALPEGTVVAADIDASNGVIHVIDKVILPEG
ncbi:MAG: hypothetical protein GKR98_01300 [Boseongicola sp.]|nr:MAG: hypothetical protein GKR98_01300 [Boseongicola sp.]